MKHSEFDVFKDYVGLKLHFNQWSFIWDPEKKYNITVDAFRRRNDKPFFTRLVAVKPTRKEWIEYLVSSFLVDRNQWIGDIFDESVEDVHRTRMTARRALEYNFMVDCENIKSFLDANKFTLKDLLTIGKSQPLLFETRVDGGVTTETMAIMDYFFNYTRQQTPNMLWEENRLRIGKYKYMLGLKDHIPSFKKNIDALLSV